MESLWEAIATLRRNPLRALLSATAMAAAVATTAVVQTGLDGVARSARDASAKAFGSDAFVIAKVATGTLSRRELADKLERHPNIIPSDVRFLERVAGGRVVFAEWLRGFGNLIIVDHGHGYTTYYAHLSKILPEIKPGVHVPRGELIGLVGSTGRSTAPHLHFEVRQNNKYIDPLDGTHQLDFWLLSSDDQVQLAKQILAPADLNAVLAAAGVAGIRAIQ